MLTAPDCPAVPVPTKNAMPCELYWRIVLLYDVLALP